MHNPRYLKPFEHESLKAPGLELLDTRGRAEPESSTSQTDARVGHIGLWIGILFCLFQVAFRLHEFTPSNVAAALVAALLCACLRLRPSLQAKIALLLTSIILSLYTLEIYISLSLPAPANAALKAGRSYDSRTVYEVVQDLRKRGVEAYPAITPHFWFFGLEHGGVMIQGREVLPLAGISNKTTVFCNESGTYSIFPSDEHGFNNPAGLWSRKSLDIAVLGDSLVEGACVAPDKGLVAYLRSRNPATLSLGMAGNGPLEELAGLREYLPPLRPRVVLWLFYENDFDDLKDESRIPILTRYLDQNFQQGLMGQQQAVDRRLEQLVEERAKLATRWPNWLDSMGLGRRVTPLWVQDLVMGENATTAVQVLCLRSIRSLVTNSLAALRYGHTQGPEEEAFFQKILENASATVSSWGGHLYFVYLPSYDDLKFRGKPPLRAYVLRLAKSVGLSTLDLCPTFLGQPQPLDFYPYPGAHFNEEGYRVAAEGILNYLGEQRETVVADPSLLKRGAQQ